MTYKRPGVMYREKLCSLRRWSAIPSHLRTLHIVGKCTFLCICIRRFRRYGVMSNDMTLFGSADAKPALQTLLHTALNRKLRGTILC